MIILEIIGLLTFIGFLIGTISLIVTSIVKLFGNDSKVVDLALKVSIWVYGIFGLSAILASIIHEFMK